MASLTSRAKKKKPVTYGKAAPHRTYNGALDLESEDELASIGKVMVVKPTRSPSSNQQIAKAPLRLPSFQKPPAKLQSIPNATTPPASRSPSTVSPSSSGGVKRASPFANESHGEQKRKVRIVGQNAINSHSEEMFDQMFPVLDAKKRKFVPKLKHRVPSTATESDNTQMLLDSQLQDSSSPLFEEFVQPVPAAKKAGLAMPSRTRGISKPAASDVYKAPDHNENAKFRGKQLSLPLGKQVPLRKGVPTVDSTHQSRPITPEKKSVKQSTVSILSPSDLDLSELDLSSRHNAFVTAGVPFRPPIEQSSSPKASPSKPKLKDRLTSDLNNMAMEVDAMSESILTAQDSSGLLPEAKDTVSTQSSSQQETQKSNHSQATQSQGPRITYGAARWTFLPDEDEEMAALEPIFDHPGTPKSNNRSRQLPNVSQSSNKAVSFDIDSGNEEEPTNSMRSLHELKRAGGSQRLSRQAEALLDDLEQSSSKNQRLTSLLELISKLRQNPFMLQFLDAGLEARLLSLLDNKLDTISKFLCCIAVMLILGNPKLPTVSIDSESVNVSAFLTSLLPVISEPSTLAGTRNNHIPKDIAKEIQKLCASIRAMSIWGDNKPITLTIRVVALKCLEQYVRRIRESGSQTNVFSTRIVEYLVDLLEEWPPEQDSNGLLTTQLVLSTLESISLQYSFPRNDAPESWSESLGHRLTTFCTRLCKSISEPWYEGLVSLSLRLCLNLSNGDAEQCAMFLDMQFITSVLQMIKSLFEQLSNRNDADAKQDTALDNLVLSLGLLINLSEKSERTRELLLQGDMTGDSGVDVLIDIFVCRVQQVFEVASEEEARSNVPFGYLAVLLGYLCRSRSLFRRIRSRLDGGNLRFLLIAIGEFLRYHEKVDELQQQQQQQNQPGEGAEPAAQQQQHHDIKLTFVVRLRGLMEELAVQDGLAAPEAAAVSKQK